MKKVLIFASYYLPAYKAGGPVKSLKNLLAALRDKADFYLLTSDRDLGDTAPFDGVAIDTWTTEEGVHIHYLSPGYAYLRGIFRAATDPRYDTVYLNSFFSFRFAVIPLLICRLSNRQRQIVIAPRGELGPGALRLKRQKKALFMRLTKMAGLYRHIIWHATSTQEAAEIVAFAGAGSEIRLAANISGYSDAGGCINNSHRQPITKLVFLSRISPKKNLLTLLKALQKVPTALVLDIYGPIEDAAYWQICEKAIAALADNKQINVRGAIKPDSVVATLAQYNLFVLPTRNENFGHVILEALEAGCYVMTTTDTPWAVLEAEQAGFIFNHDDSDALASAIANYIAKTEAEKQMLSANAQDYFRRYVRDQQAVAAMANVLGL